MIEIDCIQGEDEWFACKAGIPGASSFDRIVTSKGEPSKQAKNYAYQIAGERITGVKTETYSNGIMQRGIETEAEARQLFELMTGLKVRQTGIVFPDETKRYLCSPDGIIDEELTGLEIKCPLAHTHIAYLLAGKLPAEYVQQVQGSMLVTGFDVWHFLSYYPGLPPLHIKVERDEVFLDRLSNELNKFCELVDSVVERIKEAA